MEKLNLHKGHRQRLKNKVQKFGLEALSEHEILEFLLTYPITRKDTNELAHILINQCGGFSNVLDAECEDLLRIKGVGKETALFLTMLPKLFEVYKANKSNSKTLKIKSTLDCITYFRQNLEVKLTEYLYLVCINQVGRVVKTLTFKGDSCCKISIDIKELSAQLSSVRAYAVIMYHTHPDGELIPTDEDIDATQKIIYVCALLGILFCDHIIINNNNHFSFGTHRLLDGLFHKVMKTFPEITHNHIRIQEKSKFKYKDMDD